MEPTDHYTYLTYKDYPKFYEQVCEHPTTRFIIWKTLDILIDQMKLFQILIAYIVIKVKSKQDIL